MTFEPILDAAAMTAGIMLALTVGAALLAALADGFTRTRRAQAAAHRRLKRSASATRGTC